MHQLVQYESRLNKAGLGPKTSNWSCNVYSRDLIMLKLEIQQDVDYQIQN